MTELMEKLAALESQAAAEKDSAYVRLVLDVGTGRTTESEVIHAGLRAVDRDSSDLQRDLAAYQDVRKDFDIFAMLGERSAQAAVCEGEVREAEQRVTSARVQLREAQRAVETAEQDYHQAELSDQRMRAAVTESAVAGERLITNPTRLRFLPASFRQLMERVRVLRDERDQQNRQCSQFRTLMAEAKERMAHHEQRIRYAQSRDYYACSPSLPVDAIRERQAIDRQAVANAQSAIDADTRMILEWTTALDTASARFDGLTIALDAARASLAAALVSSSK